MSRRSSVRVDVEAIASLSYDCHGCSSLQKCCCSQYKVCITLAEMEAVIAMLPEAAGFCPGLKEDDSFANVFEETEDRLFAIDKDENDSCVFAYIDDSLMRCSLHTTAMQTGMSPYALKPSSCLLWPLAMSDPPRQILSVSDDVLDFPCCTAKRKAGKHRIAKPLQEILENLFGEKACRKIISAARKGEKEITISI